MYGGVCVCVYVCVFKIKIKREGCNFSRDKMWVWAVSIQGVDISMVTSFTSQRNKELASERCVCVCVFFNNSCAQIGRVGAGQSIWHHRKKQKSIVSSPFLVTTRKTHQILFSNF